MRGPLYTSTSRKLKTLDFLLSLRVTNLPRVALGQVITCTMSLVGFHLATSLLGSSVGCPSPEMSYQNAM